MAPGVEGCKATSWGRKVRKGDAESTKNLALIDSTWERLSFERKMMYIMFPVQKVGKGGG